MSGDALTEAGQRRVGRRLPYISETIRHPTRGRPSTGASPYLGIEAPGCCRYVADPNRNFPVVLVRELAVRSEHLLRIPVQLLWLQSSPRPPLHLWRGLTTPQGECVRADDAQGKCCCSQRSQNQVHSRRASLLHICPVVEGGETAASVAARGAGSSADELLG